MDRVGGVLVETYRIERLIAEGSMGEVYEARHLRIPRRVAVKFLRMGLQDNREVLERFRREAEVVAGLRHPNVVEIYDYNVGDDGVPYLVLEYLDGESLSARLRRERKLSLDEALPILRAVAGALAAAHARDVIHRDLKPENIVLCSDGAVKVVDFGVAKLRGAPELTAVNQILGTVPYMSPEQLVGGILDGRVDQYALAAIAYEMLAGEMAFDGSGTVHDVARRILTHVPPFVAGVPQGVNEVLFRGMARGSADRFGSVRDFERALVDAAAAPRDPALAEPSGELPPLAGEATRVTLTAAAATAEERAAADAEDPPAPPPEDAAPSKEPGVAGARAIDAPTPTIDSPLPILGGPTDEMTAIEPALAARATAERMAEITAPRGWDAVRDDRTAQIHFGARWIWVASAGVVAGVLIALAVAYALRG